MLVCSRARLRVLFLICPLALLAGCTPAPADREPDKAAPGPTAEAFIEAWSGGDAAGMAELLDPTSASHWDAVAIERHEERIFEHGSIARFEAALEEVAEPDAGIFASPSTPPQTTAVYSLAYRSDAAPKEVVLEGELDLVYDPEADAWSVIWDDSSYFPGLEEARDFYVTYKWLKRGRILDRDGRVLARGSGAAREYPFGSTAGTTIGHIEPLEKAAVKDGVAGEVGDLVGASGLEEGLDDRLAGEPSTALTVVGKRGRELDVLGRKIGRPGRDVKTTLDIEVQQAAEAAYGSTIGGSVVLDPRNGDVLAVVSSSPFDPNNYVGVPGIEPFNRALSGLYPPGSSLKVVTASAALDTGEVKETTTFAGPAEYRGVRNFESGEYASIPFSEAVKFSVNTVFAQVAEKLGAKRLTKYAERFGFNEAPALPIDAATSSFPFPADEGDLLWSSVGQAQTLASPLGMAGVAATVANGGMRMEPRLVLTEDASGKRAIAKRTAAVMTRLMQGVVTGGTGSAANVSGLGVAGKTGTAEVDVAGERKNHAWFVCFAPGDDPKVAIAVVSEYGGIGGRVAAPLARQILLGVLPHIR